MLPARAVEGLIKFNSEKRHDEKVDKLFIMALAIGLCTLKRMKTDENPFDDGIIEFMKGKIVRY